MSEYNSWAPEVFVENAWSRNALRFATQAEAAAYANDLFMRWTSTEGSRATEAVDMPNHRYIAEAVVPLELSEAQEKALIDAVFADQQRLPTD